MGRSKSSKAVLFLQAWIFFQLCVKFCFCCLIFWLKNKWGFLAEKILFPLFGMSQQKFVALFLGPPTLSHKLTFVMLSWILAPCWQLGSVSWPNNWYHMVVDECSNRKIIDIWFLIERAWFKPNTLPTISLSLPFSLFPVGHLVVG